MRSSTPWALTWYILTKIWYSIHMYSIVLPKQFTSSIIKNKTHYTHTHTYTHARARARAHTHTLTVAETGYWYELGWKYCEKRMVFSLALRDDSVVLWVNSKCGVQSKRRCESHESCVCVVGFPACGCQKKSVVYETECRHAAVQRGKQDQNYL